jgi:hypothetical protein
MPRHTEGETLPAQIPRSPELSGGKAAFGITIRVYNVTASKTWNLASETIRKMS